MSTSFPKPSGPARIMVWSTPRSVSTAFARSMSARGDTEVFWEPYLSCHYFGPNRTKKVDFGKLKIDNMADDRYTHSYISGLLNAEYPGANVLFVKCMIEGIRDDFAVVERGYKHSFLIRHPRKAFRSMYRMGKSVSPDHDVDAFIGRHASIYDDLERFYHYVETELDQGAPPIIDADDLVNYPEKLLPKYCEAMGIEYTPKMLEWESVDADQLNWHCTDVGVMAHSKLKHGAILSNAMKGQGFGKAPDLTKEMEVSPVFKEIIKNSLSAYEKLYALRIRP